MVSVGSRFTAVLLEDSSICVYSYDSVSGMLNYIGLLEQDNLIVTAVSFCDDIMLVADTVPSLRGYDMNCEYSDTSLNRVFTQENTEGNPFGVSFSSRIQETVRSFVSERWLKPGFFAPGLQRCFVSSINGINLQSLDTNLQSVKGQCSCSSSVGAISRGAENTIYALTMTGSVLAVASLSKNSFSNILSLQNIIVNSNYASALFHKR